MAVELTPEEFEALVAEALDSLPEEIARYMDNVEVVVAWRPTSMQLHRAKVRPNALLLGLYEGVPLTKRGAFYGFVPPDKITIFQEPLQRIARNTEDLKAKVRHTVIHEIAHHFGISDERLRELGAY